MPENKCPTKCWDCAKACGGCSWSDHWEHSPVPGWVAERTELRINNGLFSESFVVIECPEFEPDAPRWRKRK